MEQLGCLAVHTQAAQQLTGAAMYLPATVVAHQQGVGSSTSIVIGIRGLVSISIAVCTSYVPSLEMVIVLISTAE